MPAYVICELIIVLSYFATNLERISNSLPEFCKAHWLLRLPIAIIFFQQGFSKFPLSFDDAYSYDIPFILWFAAALGEVAVSFAIIIGGLLKNVIGDLISRLAGLASVVILLGVIITTNWSPILDIILYDHIHVLLLLCGLVFALRGNKTA